MYSICHNNIATNISSSLCPQTAPAARTVCQHMQATARSSRLAVERFVWVRTTSNGKSISVTVWYVVAAAYRRNRVSDHTIARHSLPAEIYLTRVVELTAAVTVLSEGEAADDRIRPSNAPLRLTLGN